jgi:hypothetical protein
MNFHPSGCPHHHHLSTQSLSICLIFGEQILPEYFSSRRFHYWGCSPSEDILVDHVPQIFVAQGHTNLLRDAITLNSTGLGNYHFVERPIEWILADCFYSSTLVQQTLA